MNNAKNEIVILSAARTPVGSFGGSLKNISAVKLGQLALTEALGRASIEGSQVDEVVLGCVLQSGLGQNVARQVSLGAGIPERVPAMTLNKVCGSGLRTVIQAAQIIKAGDAQLVVAGGMENMSAAPYALPKARWGARMGDSGVVDLMVQDGLWESFNDYHMGITAENVAQKYNLTREQQDQFALTSQERAHKAIQSGRFADEIVPVPIPQRKGEPILFDTDEHPRQTSLEKLAALRPAFLPDGTVTAGNASGINDGAACLVIATKEFAQQHQIKPLATIRSYGMAGVDPAYMGLGPIPASQLALERANLTVQDLDLIEANEAFAAQCLAVMQDLELNPERTNVNGGAIALGHPIGASGARILTTLLYEMLHQDKKRGMATLCIGGGQGCALIVERD